MERGSLSGAGLTRAASWECTVSSLFSLLPGVGPANKHKPWIEAEYQGIVMENDNTVLLNPPLFALDKDAPLRYAGTWQRKRVGRQKGRERVRGHGSWSNGKVGTSPGKASEEGGARRQEWATLKNLRCNVECQS